MPAWRCAPPKAMPWPEGLTGADGKATIQLGKAGRYTVSVSLLGYRKHSGTVDLKSSETMAIKMEVDESLSAKWWSTA